jgi:lysozyme family protein
MIKEEMTFDLAFKILTSPEIEGDYSNDANDPGGATRYGVTEAEARRHGYTGDMRELPLDFAKTIFKEDYWDTVRADELPNDLRYPLFDAAVNSSPAKAIMWMQEMLGIADDGKFGPITMKAVQECDAERIAGRMMGRRLIFMTKLSIWPSFGRGWGRRIGHILAKDF